MTLLAWIILLLSIGIILLVAEFFLPTHGLLGILGGLSIVGSIVVCFAIHFWLGFGVAMMGMVATPLLWAWLIRVWPRTPVGRRIVLPPVETTAPPLRVRIGQGGVAVSELRPTGVCEFAGQRIEAMSEYGIIAAGRNVVVVSLDNRRPIVQEIPG